MSNMDPIVIVQGTKLGGNPRAYVSSMVSYDDMMDFYGMKTQEYQ